jgi:hypothetical protein
VAVVVYDPGAQGMLRVLQTARIGPARNRPASPAIRGMVNPRWFGASAMPSGLRTGG